jgi:hypothetical protein
LKNFYYRKLVKSTIKTDSWLQSVDENLKSQPKQFRKYVSQFKKNRSYLIHLDMDGVVLNKPRDIAEAFLNIFNRFVEDLAVEPLLPLIRVLKSYS